MTNSSIVYFHLLNFSRFLFRGVTERSLLSVHPQTHCDVIVALSGQKPLILSLRARFVKFLTNVLNMITM